MPPNSANSEAKLRKLARESRWQIAYKIAKETGSPFFEGPVSSWSIIQIEFTSWISFYRMINELEDPPPKNVIEDDDQLELWMLQRHNENKKARQQMLADQEEMRRKARRK